MYKIHYKDTAILDLESIYSYIAQDNAFYAQDVLDKIDTSVERLAYFPKIGSQIQESIYSIVEPRYRFKIVYQISDDAIWILSIFKYQDLWNS